MLLHLASDTSWSFLGFVNKYRCLAVLVCVTCYASVLVPVTGNNFKLTNEKHCKQKASSPVKKETLELEIEITDC